MDGKAKGRAGEHEVAKLLGGKRTILSGVAGGADIGGLEDTIWRDWAVEVKRRAKLGAVSLTAALGQAESSGSFGSPRRPIVFARGDRGPWYAFCRAEDLVAWAESLAQNGKGYSVEPFVQQLRGVVEKMEATLR